MMARPLSLIGFVKRKTNFILSYVDEDSVPPEELYRALREMTGFLNDCGLNASVKRQDAVAFTCRETLALFDGFEQLTDRLLPIATWMLVSLRRDGLRLTVNCSPLETLPETELTITQQTEENMLILSPAKERRGRGMTFLAIKDTALGACLRLGFLMLFVLQLFVCVKLFHQHHRRIMSTLSVLHAAAGGVLLALLIQAFTFIGTPGKPTLRLLELTRPLFDMPWPYLLAWEILSALLVALSLQSVYRYARQHVTGDAIKEAVDLLPLGICFGNAAGDLLLTNHRMNQAYTALTGKPLVDTHALWQTVTECGEKQGEAYFIRMADGMALLFSSAPVTMQGETFTQYMAADVTEQMQVTDSLRERNEKLKNVQRRMKSLHARTMEMLLPEEILKARIHVHDRLGHLLLMGRAFLDDPAHQGGDELISTMKELGSLLQANVTEGMPAADLFADTLERVKRLGVRFEMEGDIPPSGRIRDLLGHALGECAVNAVKHAGGDRVRLCITSDSDYLSVIFESNGTPPEEPIQKLGGLLSLRRMTEGMGGSMTVTVPSDFRITLTLPILE